jgi:hypothetical protein
MRLANSMEKTSAQMELLLSSPKDNGGEAVQS